MGNVPADGNVLWLSGRYDNVVYVFNTVTRHVTTIPVGRGPHGVCVWPQPGRYSLGHTGTMRCPLLVQLVSPGPRPVWTEARRGLVTVPGEHCRYTLRHHLSLCHDQAIMHPPASTAPETRLGQLELKTTRWA